jgi:uncharacterized protein (TIGR03435 family)
MIATMYRNRNGSRLFASQIIGLPDWATTDHWDITAKVTDDLAGRPPQELFRMMAPMVQSLLEDRFKLKLHRDTQPQPTYALVLAKRDGSMGPRLHKTTADCLKEFEKCRIQSEPGHYNAVGVSIPTLMIFSAAPSNASSGSDRAQGAFDVGIDWSPDGSSDRPSSYCGGGQRPELN